MSTDKTIANTLSYQTLNDLPDVFVKPQYDPAAVTPGILHIGPSAFFRAHLAFLAHQLLERAHEEGRPLDWGITAVSLRSSNVRDALAPQDYLYTLTGQGANVLEHNIIGSLTNILCAREDTDNVLKAAADPAIRIISLTVTQKGYYRAANGLDFDHEDIRKCLDKDNPELSSIGLIVHALRMRRDQGVAPPVILSCDNLTGNGTILKNAVVAYANKIDPELGKWIVEAVPFPDTMVDRITPSLSAAHRDYVSERGIDDAWPVQAEPMPCTPLVIQSNFDENEAKDAVFAQSRIGELAEVGALFDEKIDSYEKLKVRTLNGVHMALGVVGNLSGHKFSHTAMQDPQVRNFVSGFMNEVGGILEPVPDVPFEAFKTNVVARLDNPHICDPLVRLARNGVDKVTTRFFDSINDCLSQRKPYSHIALATAAWLHYAARLDDDGFLPEQSNVRNFNAQSGAPCEPNDAKAATLALPQKIRQTAHVGSLFSEVLPQTAFASEASVINEIQHHFESICAQGIEKTLRQFLETDNNREQVVALTPASAAAALKPSGP